MTQHGRQAQRTNHPAKPVPTAAEKAEAASWARAAARGEVKPGASRKAK